MTKRIFRSIFAVALTVLLAAVFLVLNAVNSHFTNVQFAQLRTETTLAAHALTSEGVSYFDELDNAMDCRITWIDADGTVLYDNLYDISTMENHLAREEIQNAIHNGYGQSARYSDTLLERYIYTAQKLSDGTVLRLSMSQSSVLNLTISMSGSILFILTAAIFLSYYLARHLSRSVVKPLNALDLDDPLSNRDYEEITPLLRRLDSQQNQLRAQETELKKKKKEFNTVTRSLSEGLVLISSNGTVLSINPSAARLLEVTQNCLGADFSVANRNEGITALVETALTGKKSEQTVTLAAGNFLAAASPVRSGGVLSGVVLLLFDVTQKHQAEILRREFTANVSHELKTPLHAISGYAELMKSGLVPPEDTVAFAEKIYSETQRMVHLVENTLRLSHLDEGAADLQWTHLDLMEAARQVLGELAGPAELARVRLELKGDNVRIHGIAQLVTAIMFNLIDNAVKYNHPGGSVTVAIEERESEAILTVADTGIGIPEQARERIFERFYRVDKSHSKEVGGTGLGLSIVKHAAQILNARLELDSVPEKGTRVNVIFPKA